LETEAEEGWRDVPESVFCAKDGSPLDGDNLRHRVF
jgi:hypothetical protein